MSSHYFNLKKLRKPGISAKIWQKQSRANTQKLSEVEIFFFEWLDDCYTPIDLKAYHHFWKGFVRNFGKDFVLGIVEKAYSCNEDNEYLLEVIENA